IEFDIERDIDAAANDVRERIARVVDDFPTEVDAPEIFKVDADGQVMLWLNLASTKLDEMALTDFAERNLVDRLSVMNGVARVQVGNAREKSMRIWVDRTAAAARDITITDIEQALRSQNVELPAGRIESTDVDFTVRMARSYQTA